jgi:hypothetical protein
MTRRGEKYESRRRIELYGRVVSNLFNEELWLSEILSESSVIKLPKLRESDSRQRSKTLDISSGIRKPWKGRE